MTKSTTLFLGPEENLSILRVIFSSRKTSTKEITKTTGKKEGTVLNALHDLKILSLIDEKINLLEESKNIVYGRNAEEVLKELFMSVSGNKDAVEEINSKEEINPLEAGKIFCFHTNARATKENSIKQIGRLYLRWLRFLNLIEDKEVKEDG